MKSRSNSALPVTRKWQTIVIDPDHVQPHQAHLIAYLYDSYFHEHSDGEVFADFPHETTWFKKTYKVIFPDREHPGSLISQPIELTRAISVCPLIQLDPSAMTRKHLQWLAAVGNSAGNIRHYTAGQIYLAVVPHDTWVGKILFRPLVLTKNLMMQDVVTINPGNQGLLTQNTLLHLLQAYPETDFFDVDDLHTRQKKQYRVVFTDPEYPDTVIQQHVSLTTPLVRYIRKKRQERHRFAVCDSVSPGQGVEGMVYFSHGSLKFTEDEHGHRKVIYKAKLPEKARVVKVLMAIRDATGKIMTDKFGQPLDRRKQNTKASREYSFLQRMSIFHVKPPVLTLDNTRAAIIQRCFQGCELFAYLQEDSLGLNDLYGRMIPGTNDIFTITQRLELSILLCEALLNQVHRHGIIHRDIKPENIILQIDAHMNPLVVYIIDFGLAINRFEWVGCISGTEGYIAPEVMMGSQATEASDTYALGLILDLLWGDADHPRVATLPELFKARLLAILAGSRCENPRNRLTLPDILQSLRELKADNTKSDDEEVLPATGMVRSCRMQ